MTSLKEIYALRDRAHELYAKAERVRAKAVEAEDKFKDAMKQYWEESHEHMDTDHRDD